MQTTTTRIHPELPIFCLNKGEQFRLYTPGHPYPITQREADALRCAFTLGKALEPSAIKLATVLEHQAWLAKQAWDELTKAPFTPVCLTVYLSNRCNLHCSYCFAAQGRMNGVMDKHLNQRHAQTALPIIREEIVERAAQVVASHCAQRGKPFTLVLHGGGEPTLHWELLQRLVSLTRRIATMHGIGWWGYIATHGVLSKNKAVWLASHFDLIGLSCDGPPEIQDRQRPTTAGVAASKVVERTARIFTRLGTPFVVRATITPETMNAQTSIVRYIQQYLGARIIRFEPVYQAGGNQKTSFAPEDAKFFARYFQSAQEIANQLGCKLDLSGVRPEEIHGPYCNILRDVLQLTPDAGIAGCFLDTNRHDAMGKGTFLGQAAMGNAPPFMNMNRIAELRRSAMRIPTKCWSCVNIYHCVRECPEGCLVSGEWTGSPNLAGFRCQLYQHLTEDWIYQSCSV